MRVFTKRPLIFAASFAALLSLGGCVYPAGYYDDGYGYGSYYGDEDYYDGYYDGFYGPYGGGYWAIDGFFYYWLNDRYYRDDHRHFRRQQFPGANRFRGDRDGPNRWRQHGYQQPPQYQQQLPPPVHPPRHRQQPGGQQPDHH